MVAAENLEGLGPDIDVLATLSLEDPEQPGPVDHSYDGPVTSLQ